MPDVADAIRLYAGDSVGHGIEILVGHEGRTCYLHVRHHASGVIRRDGLYPNARALSADLRAALGLAPAADWLRAQGVPLASDLYDLNHDGAEIRAYFARTDRPLTPESLP